MRWLRLVALVAGVALLLGGGVTVVRAGRAQAERDQAQALQVATGQQAEALEAYFERAQALILTISRTESFRDFYAAPGTRSAKVDARGPALIEAIKIMTYLELVSRQFGRGLLHRPGWC